MDPASHAILDENHSVTDKALSLLSYPLLLSLCLPTTKRFGFRSNPRPASLLPPTNLPRHCRASLVEVGRAASSLLSPRAPAPVVRSTMGKKGLVVVTSILAVLTIVFGVISAVLLALKHHQDDHGEFSSYRRSPAMPCGVVAAMLASMTQILASVAICCCGAWRITKGAKRIAAVVFFIISWVLAIIAVLLFLAGAMLGFEGSAKKTVANARIVGGVAFFVIATFLFLIVVALEVASYLLVRKDHYQAYVGSNPPLVPTTTYKDGPNASAPAPPNQV